MEIKNILSSRRIELGLTMKDVADAVGVSESTISRWESGNISNMKRNRIFALATVLKLDPSVIMGWTSPEGANLRPLSESLTAGIKIPVLGKVPAGVPIEAVEDIIDEIELTATMANDRHDYFALLVSGNSMYPEYMDGDIVIVRKQETAETGDDVVAYVNGYDATLKRLVRSTRGITLRPLNPEFEPHTYTNEEIEKLPIRIAGIVVEQRRSRR